MFNLFDILQAQARVPARRDDAVDDAGLAQLLEPYAGHRYRVQYLVHAAGLSRPRRGPRLSLPTHLPARF